MTRAQQLLSFAVLVTSVTGASVASARPTKVALTIESDSNSLRKAINGALDDSDVEVVPAKQVTRAIDRLGLDDLDERGLGKLAAQLDVDAVVKGAVDASGSKLRLTLFSNGKTGKPFTVKVGKASPDVVRMRVRVVVLAKLASTISTSNDDDAEAARSDKHRAKAKAKAAKDEVSDDVTDDQPPKAKAKLKHDDDVADDQPISRTAKHDRGGDVGDADLASKRTAKAKHGEADERTAKTKHVEADEPTAKAKHGEADERTPKTKHVDADEPTAKAKHGEADEEPARAEAKQVAARDGDASQPGEHDDDDPAPSAHARLVPGPASTRGANLAAMRVDIGASMSGRSLRFKSTVSEGAPPAYQNAPVAGGRVEAELYPFAFDRTSPLAGLGVAADIDQTAALTLHASNEMTVPLKVTERHFSVGARFRIAFGHQPTSPTLTIGAGYGARTFAVDRSGLMTAASLDLPDVDYRLFDPGLTFRLPLGRVLAVTLGGRALLVSTAGAIEHPDQYGKARVYGGSATAGIELVMGNRVTVRLVGEATRLDLKFAGTGTLSNSRDGNSYSIDVRGATDLYYGGAATLAVMY